MFTLLNWSSRFILAALLFLATIGKVHRVDPIKGAKDYSTQYSSQHVSAPSPADRYSVVSQPLKEKPYKAGADIISTMRQSGNFSKFLALIEIAGLTDSIRSAREVTVFAPTDSAFAKSPNTYSFEILQKPAKRKILIHLLTYHMLRRKMMLNELRSSKTLKTVNGKRIQIGAVGTTPSVDNIPLEGSEKSASNGTIFVIDSLLIPPRKQRQ